MADQQSSIDPDSGRFKLGDFAHQRNGIDDDTVADHARDVSVEDSGRKEVEDVLSIPDAHRMTRVRASLVTRNDIGVLGKHVDDFSLPLITPLGAYDDLDRHEWDTFFDNALQLGSCAPGCKRICVAGETG
jgi:hypothetical protein